MSLLNMMLHKFWHENLTRRIGLALGGMVALFWLLSELIGLYCRYVIGIQSAHDSMHFQLQAAVQREEQRFQYDEKRVALLMHTWLGLRERLLVDHSSEQVTDTVFIPFQSTTPDSKNLLIAREVISLFGNGASEVRSNLFLVLPGQGVVFYRPTIDIEDLQRAAVELERHSQRENGAALVWDVIASRERETPLSLVFRMEADNQMLAGQIFYREAFSAVHDEVQIAVTSSAGHIFRASPESAPSSLLAYASEHGRQEPMQVSGFYVLCMPMRYPLDSMVMIYPQEMISRSTFALMYSTVPWRFFAQIMLLMCAAMFLKWMLGAPLQHMINLDGSLRVDGKRSLMPEGGPDELGRIARLYNRLLRLISSGQQTLEQQVLVRTRELAEEKCKAERTSIRKSEHLANLSHEIRTPLNGVMGSLTLLERSNLPARPLELLRIARQSSALLLEIINDMLDFSRIESGQMTLTYGRVGMLQIFDQALLTVTLKAQERGLKLTAFVAADVPQDAIVDGLRIRQILVNLLGNAVKFTEEGEIRLRAEMRGDRLSVTVSDTGKGIAKECHERVFQPFVQGSAYDSGTGLGLAIAWRLTQMMEGELTLVSDSGAGASFTLCVPLQDASAPPPVFSARLPAPLMLHQQLREWGVSVVDSPSIILDMPELVHMPGHLRQILNSLLQEEDTVGKEASMSPTQLCPWSLKILIVDDVATNRRILECMLCEMGHVVEAVPSAFEALRAGRSHVFDLVLMDIRMPEVDGFTAARAWQAEGSAVFDPDTPIIAVSANTSQEGRERAKEAGMYGYLTKPIAINDLAATLSEVAVLQVARGVEMPPNRILERPLVDLLDESTKLAAIAELMSLHAQVATAWNAKKREQMLDALHALKGCAGLVGMSLVSQAAEYLENQIRRDEVLCEANLHDLRRLICSEN